jgi:hypothetical protein
MVGDPGYRYEQSSDTIAYVHDIFLWSPERCSKKILNIFDQDFFWQNDEHKKKYRLIK